jgi:hypothetical protein
VCSVDKRNIRKHGKTRCDFISLLSGVNGCLFRRNTLWCFLPMITGLCIIIITRTLFLTWLYTTIAIAKSTSLQAKRQLCSGITYQWKVAPFTTIARPHTADHHTERGNDRWERNLEGSWTERTSCVQEGRRQTACFVPEACGFMKHGLHRTAVGQYIPD